MDGIIMILIGVYCALVGFKVISASKKQGPECDAWHKQWGLLLKIAGPVMIIAGIVRLIVR